MARRYKTLNKYDSQLHRCVVSGLRFYESEMVRVGDGQYIHRKFLDQDHPVNTRRQRERRRHVEE